MDKCLSDHTAVSVDNIILLLNLCHIRGVIYKQIGVIYKQIYKVAMGTLVSVNVANLVREDVEDRTLKSFAAHLRFWKRYVDNLCTEVPTSLVTPLLDHLSHLSSLQRRRKGLTDVYPSYVYVLLHRNSDGTLSTTVYRKSTHR